MDNTSQEQKEEKGARLQKGFRILKIALFITIVAGIPIVLFVRYPDFGQIITDREAFAEFLAANEGQNIIIYMLIVIVVTITGLPIGQVINFAGVFIFGAPLAFLLSICATSIGTLAAFTIAKYLGKEFVLMIFKEKNVEKFSKMMNTSKAYIVIVIIFMIPGFPKDAFTYAAGLSNTRTLPFVLTATVARSPAMLATMFFAYFIQHGNLIGVEIVVAVVGFFLIFAIIRRKKLFAYLESLHEKVTS